jgi:hypothetical protein
LVVAFAAMVALATAAPAFGQSTKPLPALAQGPRDGLTRALQQGEVTPAKYALERALSLFHPGQVNARYGGVERPDPHAATLILRDLSIRLDQLSAADRQKAEALLARPTDNPNPDDSLNTYGGTAEQTPVCGTHVCIHYVTSGQHAVSSTDTTPANGIPDYVDQALQVFDLEVWGYEVTTLGYRAPKKDTSSDNNGSFGGANGGKFDVYLADIGDDGFYGYCTTDDPHFVNQNSSYKYYDASAYCVVDNDYAPAQFPINTPLENLQVTAAHEFFHAIQFAYDVFEDQWIQEATAVWMEDELYDAIDDNLQYLPDGPLGQPTVPLDKGATQTDPCCHVYGDWIFFRFLSEWFGDPTLQQSVTTQNRKIVKEIWVRLDGSKIGYEHHRDDYSVQGVKNVLSAHNKVFRKVFAKFGWINRLSTAIYDEGFDNNYPEAPLSASATALSPAAPSDSKMAMMNHQTNRYYEFTPDVGVAPTAKLKLVFNLPDKKTGSAASALVFRNDGSVTPYEFSISSIGNGTFRVPFGSNANVTKVDVILTNASTRYTCWQSLASPYACLGFSKDDGRTYKFTARLA